MTEEPITDQLRRLRGELADRKHRLEPGGFDFRHDEIELQIKALETELEEIAANAAAEKKL